MKRLYQILGTEVWDTRLRALWTVYAALCVQLPELDRSIVICHNSLYRVLGTFAAVVGAGLVALVLAHVFSRTGQEEFGDAVLASRGLLLFVLGGSSFLIGTFARLRDWPAAVLFAWFTALVYRILWRSGREDKYLRRRIRWCLGLLTSSALAGAFGLSYTVVVKAVPTLDRAQLFYPAAVCPVSAFLAYAVLSSHRDDLQIGRTRVRLARSALYTAAVFALVLPMLYGLVSRPQSVFHDTPLWVVGAAAAVVTVQLVPAAILAMTRDVRYLDGFIKHVAVIDLLLAVGGTAPLTWLLTGRWCQPSPVIFANCLLSVLFVSSAVVVTRLLISAHFPSR